MPVGTVLASILLLLEEESPECVFSDNAGESNCMEFTDGYTLIHLLCISNSNVLSQITYESSSFGDTCSDPSNYRILASIKVI